MKFWIKLDRLAAWLLLFCMILYFLSGYGMTKGLIDSKLAVNIHDNWLPIITVVVFCIHGAFATRLAFIRWRVWNIFIKVIWSIVFVGLLCGFLYVDLFYNKPKTSIANPTTTQSVTNSNTATTANSSSNGNPATSTPTTTQQIFTKDTLSVYNGQNGQPSYVAIDGKVYDVSELFINGTHYGCNAGADVTSAFAAEKKHKQVILDNYQIVGYYQAN